MKHFAGMFDLLHEQAMRATGLDDFGETDYQAPLRLLLDNYDRYAHFGDVGRQMVTADAVGNLVGRLVEEQGFKSHPEHAQVRVEKPLIIIGMTRTGTTTLHRLIGRDPALQSLALWLAATPMPRPPRERWADFPAYRQIAEAYEQLYAMSPLFKAMHPQHPAEADECRIAINHSFWSPGNMGTSYAGVSEYLQWCYDTHPVEAYRRYRKVLGLIAAADRRRWLLKDPCHIWALPALVETFPDACIVFTHRDPLQTFVSFGNLVCYARQLCEPDFKPSQIGDLLPGLWGQALARAEKARAAINPAQILDLHFDEITSDPVQAVQRIYRYFDIPPSDVALRAWKESARTDPKGGHGDGKLHSAADLGLNNDSLTKDIGDYSSRYQEVLAASKRLR